MKINLKKYLLYSSVFVIFTEAFTFNYIIDWKLLYPLVLINFLFLIQLKKIKINLYFFIGLLAVFFHGLITYSVIGIPPNYMLSQILGILIISTYFYNLIPLYSKDEIVTTYTKLSFYIALIGYPMWLFNINSNDGIRFQSIFTEPAHYAIVVIPACYYFFKTKQKLHFITLFGSLVLSQSSIGYIGCGLMLIMPQLTLKRLENLAFIFPLILFIGFLVYQNNELVKLRVDDTYKSIKSIQTGKFKESTNVSSYALMSNLYIAKLNFFDHPFGSGIGSHYYMHTSVYSKEMKPPSYIKTLKQDKINAPEAASLFIRMTSDFGLFGIIFIISILVIIFKVFDFKDFFIEQGIVIYILLKLLRDGHYFPPEFYFFVWILYYSLRSKFTERGYKIQL